MLSNAMLRCMPFKDDCKSRLVSENICHSSKNQQSPVMLDLLKLPCRRVLSTAQGSFHSCSYLKHSYCRSQPGVNIDTCSSPSRQKVIQCSSVRGYANSSSGIEETVFEGFQEGGGAVSGELRLDFAVIYVR